VHVTDAVDVSLVRPRPRKYETAGAASAAAKGSDAAAKAPPSEKTAAEPQSLAHSEGKP
jgi:succinate dehydrogenase / fumarate reductase flavoprotein subunit